MYSGNIHKALDSKLYLLDFDTSCEGFPVYDLTLICNQTHYFDFDERGYAKSKEALSRFLPGYSKHNHLSQAEIDAFYDMISLYHFALQATIIEIYGLNCVDNAFLDKQLDWFLSKEYRALGKAQQRKYCVISYAKWAFPPSAIRSLIIQTPLISIARRI